MHSTRSDCSGRWEIRAGDAGGWDNEGKILALQKHLLC